MGMDQDIGLLEAIDMAMEAEVNARDFYQNAVAKVSGERGRDLLQQLAEFEQGHFDKLSELRKSLTESGQYIEYGGIEFKKKVFNVTEVDGQMEPNKDEILDILKLAIDSEKSAKEAYLGLSGKVDDPKGKEMFRKLAQEEELHWKILNDEFYHISNQGVWTWGD
jgi:rubrerythrin